MNCVEMVGASGAAVWVLEGIGTERRSVTARGVSFELLFHTKKQIDTDTLGWAVEPCFGGHCEQGQIVEGG